MENLSRLQFEQLIRGAEVLSGGRRRPDVYLTPDNKVVKLFRQKGLFTSNRLYPYARRFERNTERLRALGFHSVMVEKSAKCRHLDAYLVVYPLLPGKTIRELGGGHANEQSHALARLPGYLCALHQRGVYYKALHLGQVLVQEDGSFALLDIGSTQFRSKPVSVRNRVGNFFNILRYAEDHLSLTRHGLRRFFGDYLDCCELGERERVRLLRKLRNSHAFPDLKQVLEDL